MDHLAPFCTPESVERENKQFSEILDGKRKIFFLSATRQHTAHQHTAHSRAAHQRAAHQRISAQHVNTQRISASMCNASSCQATIQKRQRHVLPLYSGSPAPSAPPHPAAPSLARVSSRNPNLGVPAKRSLIRLRGTGAAAFADFLKFSNFAHVR